MLFYRSCSHALFCISSKNLLHLGDIDGNNLTGTLTPELGLLKELEQFAVVHNKIEGKLPDEIGALAESTCSDQPDPGAAGHGSKLGLDEGVASVMVPSVVAVDHAPSRGIGLFGAIAMGGCVSLGFSQVVVPDSAW